MIDITGRAVAYYDSLKLTDVQRADQALRLFIIDAFEQGYMSHNVH